MITKAKNTFHEYPRTFWTLIAASFVDQLGGFILFPFFALYITDHFSVGMTQVGILFTIFAASSLVGSVLGGALTDKFGRKSLILFGLLVSAMSPMAADIRGAGEPHDGVPEFHCSLSSGRCSGFGSEAAVRRVRRMKG